MKPIRLANLVSEAINQASSLAGSMDPEERDEYREQLAVLKKVTHLIIKNTPQERIELFLRVHDKRGIII